MICCFVTDLLGAKQKRVATVHGVSSASLDFRVEAVRFEET